MKKIKILGPGCPKCEKLAKLTETAVHLLNLDCEVEKVKDIQEIMKYGVMMTPAMIIDEKVKIVGKVPSLDEIKEIISKS